MSVGNLPCDIVGYLSPAINCSLWNPMLRRQIRATRFNPESLNSPVVALVQRLLRVGCPPAVSFCIRTVWVNSVNRTILRPWPHVRSNRTMAAAPAGGGSHLRGHSFLATQPPAVPQSSYSGALRYTIVYLSKIVGGCDEALGTDPRTAMHAPNPATRPSRARAMQER